MKTAMQVLWLAVLLVVTGARAQATDPVLMKELQGDLVSVQGDKLAPFDDKTLGSVKYLAFYYSAHWCPPCRAFTPKFVDFYGQMKSKYPQFEVVFVSSDYDKAAMEEYMKVTRMPWPAVVFDKKDGKKQIQSYAGSGIPDLVVVDAATGKVVSDSFAGEEYRGPQVVLQELEAFLKK